MCADKRLGNHKEEAPTTVLSRFIVRGYQASIAWGRAAQGALSFVIFSVLILLPLGWDRKCCLDGEPNSLAASLALLERSPKIVEQFQHGEYHSPKSLKSKLLGNGGIYHLRHTEWEGPWIDVDTVVQLPSPVEQDAPYRMREGWPTSGISGLSFEFVFLIITALLISIYAYDCMHNGIPTIYALNSLNYKILFSYIPTVLGLVMEPLLVTLGSYHCMFGPYKLLRRGANRRRTLCLDYDKSPLHFQMVCSLRSRNFTLAALCFAILLSNVFGSALSGMFSSSIAYTTYNLQGKSYGTPILLEDFAAREFEIYSRISTQLMSGLSIPSWTTPEYYLLPVSLDLPATATNISIPTLGLGASVSCILIPDFTITCECKKPAPEENSSSEAWVTVGQPPCSKSESSELWKYESQDSCWPQERPKGDEYQSIFKSPTCADTYFVFWREREGDGNVAMRCKITERVAEMIATVDPKGLVFEAKEVAQFTQREIAALYAEESRYVPSRRILPKLLNPITGPTSSTAGGVSNFWINYLMSTNYPSLSNNTDTGYFNLPNKTYVVEAFEGVFKQIYSMNICYQASDMISVAPGSPRDVTTTVTAVRDVVTVSTIMFGLAIGILLYTILLLPVIYRRHSSAMLPHLPVNLVQTWTALYRSEAKFECGMVRGSNPKERARQLGELGHIYEYGTFTDADGNASYGVFRKRKDESD